MRNISEQQQAQGQSFLVDDLALKSMQLMFWAAKDPWLPSLSNRSTTSRIFNMQVQTTQLKPTVFKWSDLFCFDTHFLGGSTLDLLLARRAAHTVGNGCCLDNLHCTLGNNNLAITHWGMHIPAREIWVLMYCHYARMYFSWKITVPKDASSGGFLAILNGRAEVQ